MQLKKKKWALLVSFGVAFLLLSGCNGGRVAPEPVPSAPSNLTVTANSSTQVELSWQDNSSNEKRFYLYRRSVTSSAVSVGLANSDYSQIGYVGANSNGAYDTGANPGTTYWYKVTAWNNGGESGFSNEASVTTPAGPPPIEAPTAPSNLTTTVVGYNQVDLTWQDNSNNEDGFRVFRTNSGGSTFYEKANLPASTTSYSDSNVSQNSSYWYHIQAYNSAGTGNSGSVSATIPARPPDVEILDYHMEEEYLGYDWCEWETTIVGNIRNNTGDTLTIWMKGKFFDQNGVMVDTSWDLLDPVGAGETWRFEIPHWNEIGERISRVEAWVDRY